MTAITKVDSPSLTIMVNRPPIASIELSSTLNRLTVTMDIEFSNTTQFYDIRDRIADILRPKPEDGVLSIERNRVTVSQCNNILNNLLELYQKFPGVNKWHEDKLTNQGFVHTVQMPVQALHTAGLLTDEQVNNITTYVRCHNENKLK